MTHQQSAQAVSMMGLFRTEVECQAVLLADGVHCLQQSEDQAACLETVMQSAQYIENAAKLVSFGGVVDIGQAYRTYFKQCLNRQKTVPATHIEVLLKGVEWLLEIPPLQDDEMARWFDQRCFDIRDFSKQMGQLADQAVSKPAEQYTMFDLFQVELSRQSDRLTQDILALDANAENADLLLRLRKNIQHVKQAAELVKIHPCIRLAEVMAAVFEQLSTGRVLYQVALSEHLLLGMHLVDGLAKVPEAQVYDWLAEQNRAFKHFGEGMRQVCEDGAPTVQAAPEKAPLMVDSAKFEAASKQTDRLIGLLNHFFLDQSDAEEWAAAIEVAHNIGASVSALGLEPMVEVTQAMASLFQQALTTQDKLSEASLNVLSQGADLIKQLFSQSDQLSAWVLTQQPTLDRLSAELKQIMGRYCVTQVASAVPAASPAVAVDEVSQAAIQAIEIGCISIADPSLLELFRNEVEGQTHILSEALLALEQDATENAHLEAAMRAAHSIKGAARMVGVEPTVHLAHVMEDVFVAAQEGKLVLNDVQMDAILLGVDIIRELSVITPEDAEVWCDENAQRVRHLVWTYQQILTGKPVVLSVSAAPIVASAAVVAEAPVPVTEATPAVSNYRKVTKKTDGAASVRKKHVKKAQDSAIRVSAQSLNRLMGLAGESLIESRWIRPFLDSMLTLKRHQVDLISSLDAFRELCVGLQLEEQVESMVREIQEKANFSREEVVGRISDLEDYERRATNLAARLNREVIASRMRPFADGVHGFRRMVRDMTRRLNKDVNFEIHGMATQVDRDILEQIEAPLNHVLRNAIDHGIEMPDAREAAGKPRQANIRLEAAHASGMLSIAVSDDGCGIDVEHIRRKILDKELATEEMIDSMTKSELLDFLFLPSFSTKEQVTEISGRGVGLDVVHSAMQEMRGSVRITSKLGEGTKFHLQLPLTLSVVRALTVEIAGEPYAFPLARVEHTLKIPRDSLSVMEGRRYFSMGNQHIGVLSASRILGFQQQAEQGDDVSLILVGERMNRYGLIVDRFLGERALVVHALDHRLGKVKDISSASIMDDGKPVLIIDVDDLIRSIDNLVSGGRLDGSPIGSGPSAAEGGEAGGARRVLIVDDSIVVREVERNMLEAKGYEVEIAVDGADGWNAVRTNRYDLVISDIDMPRMNGFEFVELLKRDPNLSTLPVMIVSYKDREEDRIRGMEIGADYYLTKGSLQDDTLINAVVDLIGEA